MSSSSFSPVKTSNFCGLVFFALEADAPDAGFPVGGGMLDFWLACCATGFLVLKSNIKKYYS